MAKINKSSLIKLIENLVDKLVESKVEKLVEQRIQKITPMLVEHEVNRLLREHETEQTVQESVAQPQSNGSGNKIVDDVMGDTDIKDRNELREHFRTLVNGGQGASSNRTINATSNDVHGIAAGSGNFNPNGNNGVTAPTTTPDGKPVDPTNPTVQSVMKAMNKDYSSTLKNLRKSSQMRGGKLPTNG